VNLAFHHGDSGLIAVGDDLLQADLAVAQQGDEGNEHGISIQGNDSAHFTMQRLCQMMGSLTGGPRGNTVKAVNSQDLVPAFVILGQKNAADPMSAACVPAHGAFLEDNS
jgi:hypothetical protein